jgi:hypothetical protein
MSYTAMLMFGKDGTLREGYHYPNSWYSAMLIWFQMGERYKDEFPFGMDKEAEMKAWWERMSTNLNIPYHDRITLGTTYDRAVVMKKDVPDLIVAFKETAKWLPKHCHIHGMINDLLDLDLEDITGVCWWQTSTIPCPWVEEIPEEEFPQEEVIAEGDQCVNYNVLTGKDHNDVFEFTPLLSPEDEKVIAKLEDPTHSQTVVENIMNDLEEKERR